MSRASARIALLALGLALTAPRTASAFRFDPVPPEQLAQKAPLVERDANAEAIFWRAWISDDIAGGSGTTESTREHYLRIKVFNEAGAEAYSQVQIEYLPGDVVDDIAARTTLPDGRVVELGKNAVFKDTEVRVRHVEVRRKSFAIPGVVPGAIVEYHYRQVRHDALTHYARLDFQLSIPIQRTTYYIKPLVVEGWDMRQMSVHLSANIADHPTNGYYETSATNLPAYRTEAFMPPESSVRGWMMLYYVESPSYSGDEYWRQFGRNRSDEFDEWTRPDRDTRRLAEEISGAGTDEERLHRIFDWCRSHVRIVRSADKDSLRAAGIKRNDSPADVRKQMAGTSQDADYLFAALARGAGFEVHLLRLVPRSEMSFDPAMASGALLTTYDIAVNVAGHWWLFDVGARDLPWDMLRWDEEGQVALFCAADSSRFVSTPISGPDRSTWETVADLTLAPDGGLAGRVTYRFTGHWNMVLRDAIHQLDRGTVLDALRQATGRDFPDRGFSDFTCVNGDSAAAPLTLSCKVELKDRATPAGRRLVLAPSVFRSVESPMFAESQRHYPVAFEFPWSESDTIRIHLPDGYKVESVDSLPPVLAPGVAYYRAALAPAPTGHDLAFTRSLTVGENGTIDFPRDSYADLKKLFDLIHERDTRGVTLTREGAP